MPDITLEPLSLTNPNLITTLMDDEEYAWLRELDWEYAPIRRILRSFLEQHLLPGFVATGGRKALGYTYFLTGNCKGVIGTLYATSPDAQTAADQLLSRACETLKENRRLRRIEAQIIPLNGLDFAPIFSSHDFQGYLRHYMELDLTAREWPDLTCSVTIAPWSADHLLAAAAAACRSYRNRIDAVICDDYKTEASCEIYLRSLVENPGCGVFLPGSSFVGLDSRGTPCGFILTSRLSATAAMIPQISIHPAHQGRGLGSALMHRALCGLRSAGFHRARLTVTHQNRRAYEWYLRLGFQNRRDFNAYVWHRS